MAESGLEPYPAQEEAFLELWAGKHVVLSTPTGSGKTLVATALHFKAMSEGLRSFYTAPTKALVSEKFFQLCDLFGAEQIGMLTGDASINPDADVICCTQEVLASMALRQGGATPAAYVVMDEFHFYADPARGAAWQIPLLCLTDTCFLLMSATLGNLASIGEKLEARTSRPVAHVHSDERPVPLDFEYRERPLQETVEELLDAGKAPIYVVSFTQRECAERAQALTSGRITGRDEKRRIDEALGSFRFDTTYGAELRRFLRFGIGVHHAGLLPKYRLLVERLSQRGLLKVICGTDTLGVGVNIPIRTVLLTRLSKFNGEKVALLSAREFKQITGRAGRRGFDERGSVVCQAPEHVIENKKLEARAARGGKRPARKKPPRGFVPWNRDTFERLIERPPEQLESRFDVTHGMLLDVLRGNGSGYASLIAMIDRSHETATSKRRLRRAAATVFRSLRSARILELVRDPSGGRKVRLSGELQEDFSLHYTLSLYLFDAVAALDADDPDYALDVLSLVEATVENPVPILLRQVDRIKDELVAHLKAEGVPYEERIRHLDEVTWPQPNADDIEATFELFRERHPWIGSTTVKPKSIAREMYEGCSSFDGYVREYRLGRIEGLLLRYLSQVHNVLVRSVPESARSESVYDAIAFFRALLERVDSSLLEAWERLVAPAEAEPAAGAPERPFDLAAHPRALAARVCAELHALVRALSQRDFEEAARCVRNPAEDPWPPARFEEALAEYFASYERIEFTPAARQAHHTRLVQRDTRVWEATQVLVDPDGDNLWCVRAHLDLRGETAPEGPILRLIDIGT